MATYTGLDKRLAYLFANGGGGGGSCKVISGYYHDGSFYEDQSYTQIITGSEDSLYIDLDTTTLYLFDGTDYVEVQGGGGSGGGSFTCDLLFENTNLTPTSGTSDVDKSFTLNASIDDYDSVLVMIYGYTYVSSSSGIISMMIPKSEYYKRATGSSGDAQIRDAFVVNNSTDTQRRSLCFGFADPTTIYTEGIRTVSGVEPMLYKVYGLNFGGSLYTYSTTEQVVGTWIDGKPIYEKTISFTNTQSSFSDYVTVESLTGVDKVIKMEWAAFRSANNAFYTGNGGAVTESANYNTYRIMFRYSKALEEVQYFIGGYGTEITDMTVTIQYTKV